MTSPSSSRLIRPKTLILLIFLAFFAGRFAKEFYQKNPQWFQSLIKKFNTSSNTSSNTSPSTTSALFLIEAGTRSQELLEQKTKLAHFIEALQELTRTHPHLQIQVWIYGNKKNPLAQQALPLRSLEQLEQEKSFKTLLETTQHPQESAPLASALQLLQEQNTLPSPLFLLCCGASTEKTPPPFLMIEWKEKQPQIQFSVLKLGEPERLADLELFQLAQEGRGQFLRVKNAHELAQQLKLWIP